MAKIRITEEVARQAILGGAVLGGGGGASMEKGHRNADEVFRSGMPLELVDVEDIPPETILATCSSVGAPAATEVLVLPQTYVRVVDILVENGCPRPGGFIPNECGGAAITNGWVPAALMGLPLVDALCNGRAHPTGTMGSMGLHRDPNYVSRQAAAGGDPARGMYLEMHASGSLETVASLVRQAADRAGGLVAVARNPVAASYAAKYGAPKALKQAISLGRAMEEAAGRGGEAVAEAVTSFLGGSIVTRGRVTRLKLVTSGGFDSGVVDVDDYETTFWNEYMTLEKDGRRLGTFPDLIMTLNAKDGMPATTAEVREGQEVFLILVPADRLILGEGMRCPELLRAIEPVVNKKILQYIGME